MALIANDAAARLAAAEDARAAPRRGGRGFFAAKGRRDASDASLARLDLADEETVRELLGRLPVGHLNERARLTRDLADEYSGWWQLLQSEFSVLLYGFAGAVVGGLTSPGGAVVGGFMMGVLENLAGEYIIGSELKLTFALVVIITVLLFRPSGLFGQTVVQRV